MILDNTKTRYAMERIYDEDIFAWDDTLLESTEYAMELDKRNLVLEGVVERLNYLGLQVTVDDKKEIVKELNRRYIGIGMISGVPDCVKKNWLNGKHANPAYRENLYDLCIALEMDKSETEEFFLKYFMAIPFNYKDRIDATYYYGISHKKTYLEIKTLLEEVEKLEGLDLNEDNTRAIQLDVSEIDDDRVFLDYIKNHSYCRKQQFQTAFDILHELAEENAKLAGYEVGLKKELLWEKKDNNLGGTGEEGIFLKDAEDGSRVDYKALLDFMYGFDNQERYKLKEKTLAKCKTLPKLFRENFPNDQEFARISMRTASPDVNRKALVIMMFYNFYCDTMMRYLYGAEYRNKNRKNLIMKNSLVDYYDRDFEIIVEDMRDFYSATSKMLARCGFVQMYARNPFDWLVLFCAKSSDPLDALRGLLRERYIEFDFDMNE